MEIIVPAAGLSTRFPNMRPKYTLTDHSGELMLKNALKPYLGQYKIYIGILQEHDINYNVSSLLQHELKNDIEIIVLPSPTNGPADTVYQIIKQSNSKFQNGFLIKDCDSFFDHTILDENYICISRFSDNEIIKKPSSKSYIISNDQGIVQNIAEKTVISDKFCVGGYRFKDTINFIEAFEHIKSSNQELFVSNIIQYCLSNKEIFIANQVTNYIDVGTSEEWFNYNDKSVIFCDIDGTIIEAQSKQDYNKKPKPLSKNLDCLFKLIKNESEVIFVTARPESARGHTEKMLNELGFNDFRLIMGLKNCKRLLINDFNHANPFPRAIAINIPRNNDILNHYL